MTNTAGNPHLGTALDDLLAEGGLLEGVRGAAASRVSAWQEDGVSRSLWQVAQSGYDVFVSKQGGPIVPVTDKNAGDLCVHATTYHGDDWVFVNTFGTPRIYLNFDLREPSDLYVIYSAASSPDCWSQELCVKRSTYAGGDTVYVNGFGYIDYQSPEHGHAIRLGGVGDVRRVFGSGHAIRYDGEGLLRSGECYDLIQHHLERVAHIVQMSPEAPAFEPGHGDVWRHKGSGVALRAGDGPGDISGVDPRDDRPKRGRRKLRVYHRFPNKEERENWEVDAFIRSWGESDPAVDSGDLECVRRGEKPDRIVRNRRTGDEYGVELTSVYLHDRSVIDDHQMLKSQTRPWWLWSDEAVDAYLGRIAEKVEEKVDKARGYDRQHELVLAMYLNERILRDDFEERLQDFTRRHSAFRSIAPFKRIVFTGIGFGVVLAQG